MRKRPRLFERLRNGLEQGIAHARGEIQLRETTRSIPLPPLSHEYGPDEVKSIRERLGLAQGDFAVIFLVSVKTIQSWEQGTRSPSPAASRLLQIIDDPEAMERFQELTAR